ncbi:hypothetical protein SCA6_012344 [Theobroma cacao]
MLCLGTYIDKKCPFTDTVSIRGRILAGTCHGAKMMRTIIVRRNYLHYVKKYQRQDLQTNFKSGLSLFLLVNNNVTFHAITSRYEKRHSNIPAHISPCFRVKEGDHVIIGQCRFYSALVKDSEIQCVESDTSWFFWWWQESLYRDMSLILRFN